MQLDTVYNCKIMSHGFDLQYGKLEALEARM